MITVIFLKVFPEFLIFVWICNVYLLSMKTALPAAAEKEHTPQSPKIGKKTDFDGQFEF